MTAANQLVRPLPDVPRSSNETPYSYAIQVKIVRLIADYRRTFPYPPTIREIADLLDSRSTCPISTALGHLRAKGIITWDPGRARTLRIIYDRKKEART